MEKLRITIRAAICIALLSSPAMAQERIDTVEIVSGVECLLPEIISTGELLNPCSYPAGFASLREGDIAVITYDPATCASICMQGTGVAISTFRLLAMASIDKHYWDAKVVVYPQPTSGFFTIKSPNEIDEVQLYTPMGQLILSQQGNGKHIFDISAYENGLYLLKVKSQSTVRMYRLFKN